MTACARGCTRARRHRTECEDREQCRRGCLPRDAEYGLLCYGCHKRFLDMLKTAPGQVMMLELAKAASLAHPLKEDHERRGGEDEEGAPTPYSLAVHDCIELIAGILSAWVEMLCEDYHLKGPETFGVESGSRWLSAQHERLEASEAIADLWWELAEAMSQAHSLAPWREQSQRINGIPCPECHRMRLTLFGGDEDLTCLNCRASVTPGRYAIWVRMLTEQAQVSA